MCCIFHLFYLIDFPKSPSTILSAILIFVSVLRITLEADSASSSKLVFSEITVFKASIFSKCSSRTSSTLLQMSTSFFLDIASLLIVRNVVDKKSFLVMILLSSSHFDNV